MIYRISQVYLDSRESTKNWTVFATYMIVATTSAVSLQMMGAHIAPILVLPLGFAIWLHWKLNQVHRRNVNGARRVEVEVVEDRLVWRGDAIEQSFKLGHLASVKQASKFEPVEIEIDSGESFQISGLEDADLLVAELSKYARK